MKQRSQRDMMNPVDWMRSNATQELIFLLISALLFYAGYVYILQNPVFYVKSWLARLGMWLGLFVLLNLGAKPLAATWSIARRAPLGVLGLVAVANLTLVVNLPSIPYTTFLLPVRSVTITPISNAEELKIELFSSESEGVLYLKSFNQAEGWISNESGAFILAAGEPRPLVWTGRPGEYVELRFTACAACGRVQIESPGSISQEVDLSNSADPPWTVVRVNFPSLFLLRALNLAALEAVLLLLAAALFAILERLRVGPQPGENRGGQIGARRSGFILLIFGLIVYGPKLQPILFNDDWCQVAYAFAFDVSDYFMQRRPLHLILPEFFNWLLPPDLAVWGLQVAQLSILLVTALLCYLLIKELFNGRDGLALVGALLWLVYPNDYTRLYLATIAARLACLLTLAALLLTLRFFKNEQWRIGWLCGALLFSSFMMYEGQLGLALIWPAALWLLRVGRFSRRRWLGLAGYGLGIAAFLYWRLVVQPSLGYFDSKLDYMNLAPGDLLLLYINGLRTILDGFQLPLPFAGWLTPVNGLILAGLLVGALLVYRSANRQTPAPDAAGAASRLIVLGFALWAAGYFPIILNYPINIYGIFSRVNIFSTLGTVILLTALVDLIAVEWQKAAAARITLTLMLALTVSAAVVQLQVQDSYNASWQETKDFYRELFAVAPDLRQGTRLVLTFTGYEELPVPQRAIFTSYWEASCALATLYDQPHLSVDYQYASIFVPAFPSNNVLDGALFKTTFLQLDNPQDVLALDYDHRTHQVRVRPDLAGMLDPRATGTYMPQAHIVPLERPIPFRSLVK